MYKSYLTHDDIIGIEPSLSRYLDTDTTNYNTQIENSKEQLMRDLKNRDVKLKQLMTPLSLTDATLTDIDEIERTRLVIIITAITDTPTWVLQGTNESDGSDLATVTTNNTIQASETGTVTFLLEDTYDYYKLTVTGTVTATYQLVETVLDLPHLYLALELVYKSLMAKQGDVWLGKTEMYQSMYNDALQNALMSIDRDEDGVIVESEMEVGRVRFSR